MDVNIYSEPLFPVSQACTPSVSSSSTSVNQSQLTSGGNTQDSCSLAKDRVDVLSIKNELTPSECPFDAVFGSGEGVEEERVADSDEEPDEFDLESLIVPASELKQDYSTIGCQEFDKFMRGGIPTFGITELYGDAGTGKTQVCLQLALTAQLPKEFGGLAAGVYFICTEGPFPSKRLAEMLIHLKQKFPNAFPEEKNLMDHIFVEQVTDVEGLRKCVDERLKILNIRNPDKKIRMVIIDSIAGIFRSEYESISTRTYELRRLAQRLHEFSHENQSAIVVCNQVTASIDLGVNVASLGMAWKNMVSTRICLQKSAMAKNRHFVISFSPHLPSTEIQFQIFGGGVKVMDCACCSI